MSEVKRYSVHLRDMATHLEDHAMGTEERVVVDARDYDALAQQLADCQASLKACRELSGAGLKWEQELIDKLAARDKRLEEAVALLRRASRCCQGRGAGALKEAIKTFLSPAEAKEND